MATGFFRFSLLVGLVSLAVAGVARGALVNDASVSITPTAAGGTGPVSQSNSGAGAQNASVSGTGGLASSGNAAVQVTYGIIQMQGAANGSIDAVATGVYRDSFTLNATGVTTGTAGRLTFNIGIDGDMDATSGLSYSQWDLSAEIGGGALQPLDSGSVASPDNTSFSGPGAPFSTADSPYSANVNFQFGVATTLEVQLIGTASARDDSDPGAATFNFGQELFWQGIDNVVLQSGPHSGDAVDQDQLALTSDSGTNWLDAVNLPAPVPEPGAGLVLLVGIGLLVRRNRSAAR